jgi:hypothetical protein
MGGKERAGRKGREGKWCNIRPAAISPVEPVSVNTSEEGWRERVGAVRYENFTANAPHISLPP